MGSRARWAIVVGVMWAAGAGCGDDGSAEDDGGVQDAGDEGGMATVCETALELGPPDAGGASDGGMTDAGADGSTDGGTFADAGVRPECTGDGTAPTYEGIVAALLAEQCTGCHDDPPQLGAMVPLDTYEATQQPSMDDPDRPLYEVMADRVRGLSGSRMPPSCRLPEELVSVLVEWAQAGAPLCDM